MVVSCDTIRRELNNQGLKAFSPIKRPLLSKKNQISRFEICQKWSFESNSFWDNVIFSDECKFNVFTSDGASHVWRKSGTGLDPHYVTSTVKHGRGNVMMWSCFSASGIGNPVFIDETMDKYVYTNILANNLFPSAAKMGLDTFIFQQDNDPKHTSAHVKKFFEHKNVSVLEWPSQSPDLNPMEHVWAHMKKELGKKRFQNRQELKTALLKIWNNLDGKFLKKLAQSMSRRITAVLRASGSYTKY
jgi:hypothetical protein